MSLSQFKEGKVQIYDYDKLNEIIALLDDGSSEQTRLNVVQLICNLAEYPPAKEKFIECIETLKKLHKSEAKSMPLVSKFAQKAVEIIEWKP